MAVWLTGLTGQAQAASVAGGQGTITVKRNLANQLSKQGVRIGAVRPATMRRNTARLPFGGGNFLVDTNDPAPMEPLAIEAINGNGALRGGLRLTRRARGGNASVTVTGLRVNLQNRRVTGKVNRRRLALFTINMGWATPAGIDALRPTLLSAPLRLTAAGARHINRGLGRRVLPKNTGFGTLSLAPILAAS